MLNLSNVTLWAYATVFHKATAQALIRCLKQARFCNVVIFTDDRREFVKLPVVDLDGAFIPCQFVDVKHYGAGDPAVDTNMRRGADQVSVWMLTELPKYAHLFSEHALGIQWDAWIVNPDAWRPEWLNYDYIGAAWGDGVVGNTGFWLTSRKLFEAIGRLKLPPIPQACHPFDVRLSYTNCPLQQSYLKFPGGYTGFRGLLEADGMRWAPKDVADQFSVENQEYRGGFGFHGTRSLCSVVRQGLI